MQKNNSKLLRVIGLPLITFYGLGNILGAGIYVLIGKVAGHAGYQTPLAFIIASLVACLTAFTFAEFSSRYPLSAGPAVYVQKGFGIRYLSVVVGLLIIITGIVSASTITRGFTGYFNIFVSMPDWLVILLLITTLGILAVWGISQSLYTAAIFTIIEILGLVLVIVTSAPLLDYSIEFNSKFLSTSMDTNAYMGIFLGAFLAFYAYVGFEDIVHVAEEVTNPQRNLPLAILFSLIISTIFYVIIAVVVLNVLSPDDLSQSDAPLASVYQKATGNNPLLISAISLFAVVNGALIQIIMASRVCYGMSRQGWLPDVLGTVSEKTHTPIYATLIICLLIIIMALWLPIEALARLTSFFLLIIFSLVNLALIFIKIKGNKNNDTFRVPIIIPVLGFTGCMILLLIQTIATI